MNLPSQKRFTRQLLPDSEGPYVTTFKRRTFPPLVASSCAPPRLAAAMAALQVQCVEGGARAGRRIHRALAQAGDEGKYCTGDEQEFWWFFFFACACPLLASALPCLKPPSTTQRSSAVPSRLRMPPKSHTTPSKCARCHTCVYFFVRLRVAGAWEGGLASSKPLVQCTSQVCICADTGGGPARGAPAASPPTCRQWDVWRDHQQHPGHGATHGVGARLGVSVGSRRVHVPLPTRCCPGPPFAAG